MTSMQERRYSPSPDRGDILAGLGALPEGRAHAQQHQDRRPSTRRPLRAVARAASLSRRRHMDGAGERGLRHRRAARDPVRRGLPADAGPRLEARGRPGDGRAHHAPSGPDANRQASPRRCRGGIGLEEERDSVGPPEFVGGLWDRSGDVRRHPYGRAGRLDPGEGESA